MIYIFTSSEKIRLDEFLRKYLPQKIQETDCKISPDAVSNSKIRRLIVAGSVFVNGLQNRRPAFELRGRSEIKIDFDIEKFFYEKQPDDVKFEVSAESVLFEDEYLICINKPAFFPVEETIVGAEKRDNLHDAVVRYLWAKNPALRNPPYVGIMHRLDRETSGVILFTKQRSVNKEISEMFSSHDFKKYYIAAVTKSEFHKKSTFVHGDSKNFSVQMPMNRVSSKSQAAKWGFVPEERGGLNSKTDFIYIEEKLIEGVKVLLYKADLFTGRTHQIRVHLSEAGFPIFGDEIYGGRSASRIHLHAQSLIFNHPVSKSLLTVEAPLNF